MASTVMSTTPTPPGCYQGGVESYFTYKGLLKQFFRSNMPVAERFVDWATNVVYTAHMGTSEQRMELARSLVTLKSVTNVIDMDKSQVYFRLLTETAEKWSNVWPVGRPELGVSMEDLRKYCVVKIGYTHHRK